MSESLQANRLLSFMTTEDLELLRPSLSFGRINKGQVLCEPGEPIVFAYFPTSCVGSVVAISSEGQRVEAGLFGREGVSPVELLHSAGQTPSQILVQVPGDAFWLPATVLMDAMERSVSLRTLLNRYAHTFFVQTAQTALSNAVHPIDERLARWILMCDDRLDGDLQLTHEFLSLMLAVRRPSITTSLHVLEGNGFIKTGRGLIVLQDRVGLEEFARDAYGQAEAEYRRLLGPMRPTQAG